MIPVSQIQIKELLKQVTSRSAPSREQRVESCEKLKLIFLQAHDIKEISMPWREVCDELLSFIITRGGPMEMKKAAGVIMGAVGGLLVEDYNEFSTFIWDAVEAAHRKAEDEKVILVSSFVDSLWDLDSRDTFVDDNVVKEMMTRINTQLNENSVAALHLVIMNACLYIAAGFPNVFRSSFEDVTDCAIGWYVEEGIAPDVLDKCEEMIIGMASFWQEKPDFACDLMAQFRDDILVEFKELPHTKTMRTAFHRAAALLKVHSVILKVFRNHINYSDTVVKKTVNQILDAVPEYCIHLQVAYSAHVGEFFSSLVNVFDLVSEGTHKQSSPLMFRCCEIVTFLLRKYPRSVTMVNAFCKWLRKLHLSVINMEHLIYLVDILLVGEPSFDNVPLLLFPLSRPGTAPSVISLISVMMDANSMPNLQATYNAVCDLLKDCISTLSAAMTASVSVCVLLDVENRFIGLLKSFDYLSTVKNSFVVMMGLQPSLFEFLTSLPLREMWLIENFPAAHYALVHTVYRHCKSHQFFLSNSNWLLTSSGSSMNLTSSSSGHANFQLVIITDMIEMGKRVIWGETRQLLDDWLEGLLSEVPDFALETLLGHDEFIRLKNVLWKGVYEDPTRQERISSLMSRIYCGMVSDDCEALEQLLTCREKTQLLDYMDGSKLWQLHNMKNFIRAGICSTSADCSQMCQMKVNPSRFANEDFALITHFILHRQLPSLQQDDNTDGDWMLDTISQLYSTCQTIEITVEQKQKEEKLMDRWRWALAQTANFCIEFRMRTQYGNPMETFTAFSTEIHRLAKEAFTGQRCLDAWDKKPATALPVRRREKDTEDDDGIEMKDPRTLSPAEEWWRVRCLLEFIEILEKLMFNAYSGTVFPLAPVCQSSRQFFLQNINSCQEWLSRVYPSAMAVAHFNGYYSQVIRFGSSALSDLERRQQNTVAAAMKLDKQLVDAVPLPALVVMEWMIKALIELGSEQSILGIAAWAKKVYKIDSSWIFASAHMASGRFERAMTELKRSLVEENTQDTTKKCIRELLISCISRLRLPELVDPSMCPPDLAIWDGNEENKMDSPSGFDEDAYKRAKELCVFGKVEHLSEKPILGWWMGKRMERMEHVLMSTLRRSEVSDIRNELSRDGRMVLAADSSLRTHTRIASIHHIASTLHNRMMKKGADLDEVNQSIQSSLDPHFIISCETSDIGERLRLGRQMLMWGERLGAKTSSETHIAMARLARKTENRILSSIHLQKVMTQPHMVKGPPILTHLEVERQGSKMMWSSCSIEQKVAAFSRVFSLTAQIFDLDMFQKMSVQNGIPPPPMVAEFAPNGVGRAGIMDSFLSPSNTDTECAIATSHAALSLANWLNYDGCLMDQMHQDYKINNLWLQLETCRQRLGGSWVGSLLSLASRCAPHSAKAQQRLADWALSNANNALPYHEKAIFEQNYSMLLGPQLASKDVLSALWDALGTCTNVVQLEQAVKDALKGDVKAADGILTGTPHYVNMWNKVIAHRTELLRISVASYFSYIYQMGNQQERHQGSMGTVSATLHLLDMLVRHADILQESLDQGLRRTNEHMWKDILPQLFARLSHPSKVVRECILNLLKTIGLVAPHAVVFQVVSGASSQMLVESDDVIEGGEEEIQEQETKDRSLMFHCCREIEVALSENFPVMVNDVREFVNELQRINLLNEERWAFVLANLGHDMEKRMEQIRVESERTLKAEHLGEKARLELVQEKARLITSSIYRLLDDLYERTCLRDVCTPNEKSFIDQYGEQIKNAFASSKANRNSPEKAWAPFRQLLALLMQRTARRGGHILQMSDISNMLSKLANSRVPIPGQERRDYSEVVYVDRIGRSALVLPTKTRPKKITLIGSDGKEQIFLFKGQEDLHLDERIMQMLHICNLMLQGSSTTGRSWPCYEARHYAVTPLGTRSGLIQWVSGCTPLFHLYRKWQTRQVAIKAAIDRKNGVVPSNEVERPSDLYNKKLKAAFQAHKVEPEIINDRSRWPAAVLKDVLVQLMKETPKDLLSRELWIRSGGGDTWWSVVNRMARSTAVMSMIGSILGLGDRHLDNLLVNLDTGHMVHIDYNICFDKGRHLRVPETVPFRLTPNLVHAMGPTQVEGVFRESSQQVLDVLREGRETLLTVLDAFVYDPLVDWAAAQDHLASSAAAVNVTVALAVYGTDSRAVGAKPVARQMFSVRVREFGVPWKKNRDSLIYALQTVNIVLLRQQKKAQSTAWNEDVKVIEADRVDAGRSLKGVIQAHHTIMKNFRPLLKALASCDERFAAFLRLYRERLFDPLIKGHQLLEGDKLDLEGCISQFEIALAYTDDVYQSLIALDHKDTSSSRQGTPQHAPPPGFEDARPLHLQQQEQNTHAKNVSRKVRARLEGKIDPVDQIKSLDAREQVDLLIRHSTSISLLSLMYEGWTAWV